MNEINDGGSAFPAHWNGLKPPQQGMTLRDWFAGKVLSGLLADGGWNGDQEWFETCARSSYRVADAMLKARGEKP